MLIRSLLDEVGQDVAPDPETCEYDENVSSEWDRGDLSPWWWWKRECNYELIYDVEISFQDESHGCIKRKCRCLSLYLKIVNMRA